MEQGAKSSQLHLVDRLSAVGNKFKCPDFVKQNPVAYKKWRELTKLFKGCEHISSSDTDCIGLYCMAFSDYIRLLEQKGNAEDETWLACLEAIDEKSNLLLQLEDRLFLTPLSRWRANNGIEEEDEDD